MDEGHTDPSFQEVFAPRPAPAAGGAGPRRGRWMLPVLIAVYSLSAVAALVLISRRGTVEEPSSPGSKASLLRLAAAKEPGVGWISIHGPIYESESGRPWEQGMEQWNRHIKMMADRPEVRAIVLDINSPGGSVGAVQELYDTIQRVRSEKKKPVVTLVGDVAASGGFYLASATDKIVSHPGSIVGSIGVIFETVNVQQLLGKIGVTAVPVKSGKMKDIGSPTRAMTPEERALLQGLIDDAYGQFLEAVSQGRNIPIDKLKPLADGRIFSGRQALSLGLIDALGDSHDAVMLAAKLANLSGKPKVYREGESWQSMLEMLDSGFSRFLHPEASLFSSFPPLSAGLEYRWAGL